MTNPIIGADFSRWQGAVPFAACAEAGIEFAWIKAGHGLGADPMFSSNWSASAGVFVRGRGAYLWLTPQDPEAQAEAVVDRLERTGDLGELVIMVDNEEPATKLRGEPLLVHVIKCLRRVEELSGSVGHYSGSWYLDGYIGNKNTSPGLIAELASYHYWHAQYPRLELKDRRACGISPPTIPPPTLPRIFAGLRDHVDVHQFDGDGGCVLPDGVDADFDVATEQGLAVCTRAINLCRETKP